MISRRKFTTIPSFNYWRYSQTQFDSWQIEHKNENSSWSIHEQDRNKLAHRNEEGYTYIIYGFISSSIC